MKKIYKKYAVLVSVCILLLAAAASSRLMGYIRSGVRRTTVQIISELTDNKVVILNAILNEAKSDLSVLSEYIGAVERGFSTEILEEFERNHGSEALVVRDAQGTYLYGGEAVLPEAMLNELEPKEGGKSVAVSDVVRLDGGKRCILLGTRIPGGGSIYTAISVELLQKAYGENTYKNQGYSYIVQSDGNIEVPPIRYSYEQIYDNIRCMLEADGNGNDEKKIDAFMNALARGQAGSVVFSFEGQQQMLCFKPLENGSDWQMITVVPLAAVEADGAQIIRASLGMAGIIVAVIAVAVGLCVFFNLMMKRKQRENDRFLRNVYQAVSENIDTVIFILDDRTSRLDYIFENSQRLLGIAPREFLEGNPEEEKESTFKEAILSLWREEKPDSPVMRELHVYNDRLQKDMWLKVLICPVLLGGVAKHIYAVTDVTEERRSREAITAAVAAAEQASLAKSRFLANMSHDMRTPMNGIVGMTAIARRNLDDRNRVEDCLNKIELSSGHLLGLINDVLDMSKIESGKLTLESEPFDLRQIFCELEKMLRPQCEDKGQTLTVTLEARHTKLLGDNTHLRQVFMNLLSNAMKFTPQGGAITFTGTELEQIHKKFASYRFVVADTGIGMSPEFLNTIFTPFERADVKHVQKTEGTGLGMAIAKNLVSAMGGRIFVESELGQGSSFIVELELLMQDPVSLRKCTAEAPDDGIRMDFTGRRVLLAEDNEINREIAAVILQEWGIAVEEAEDGRQALDRFLSSSAGYYDLILMDIMMPVLNGYETALAVRASAHPQARSIPIVAMTANAFAEDVKMAMDAGMNAHVAKPIDMDVLYRTMARVM